MEQADLFLEKYKQLEEAVRTTYGLRAGDSISYYLSSHKKYERYKAEITYCQEVRNLLSHKVKLDDHFAVEPSPKMIEFITKLIDQIKNRKKCYEIKTGMGDIYAQPLSGNVRAAIRTMREKNYSKIPIMEGGLVIGLFDGNSVFDYLADEGAVGIEDSLTFADIRPYISLAGRDKKDILFFPENRYVEELEDAFETAFRNGTRIRVAFLTRNGSAAEKLLGIITPWDLIAAAE